MDLSFQFTLRTVIGRSQSWFGLCEKERSLTSVDSVVSKPVTYCKATGVIHVDGTEDEARNFFHLHFFLTDPLCMSFGPTCSSLGIPHVVITAGRHFLIRNSWGQMCFGTSGTAPSSGIPMWAAKRVGIYTK